MTADAVGRPGGMGAAAPGRAGVLTVPLLRLAAAVLRRLPDRLLHRAAQAAGLVLYTVQPARRPLVRSNLARIAGDLAASGRADARVAAAAGDPRQLERMVRSAFGHYVRYYMEMLLTPGVQRSYFRDRVQVETPDELDRAFGSLERGLILVGIHMGAIEMPGTFVVQRAGVPVNAPMEVVADRRLQDYLERTRGASGVRLLPLAGAHRVLREALGRGEVVGLISDREVAGGSQPVRLFGAQTPLPAGAALLALETGAPLYVAAVRRTGYGDYSASILQVVVPAEGRLRERVGVVMERMADAFERLIAPAPDQWWTIFFPIWPEEAP
jgi:phosphatidylinositol dimannoside acyltransferase